MEGPAGCAQARHLSPRLAPARPLTPGHCCQMIRQLHRSLTERRVQLHACPQQARAQAHVLVQHRALKCSAQRENRGVRHVRMHKRKQQLDCPPATLPWGFPILLLPRPALASVQCTGSVPGVLHAQRAAPAAPTQPFSPVIYINWSVSLLYNLRVNRQNSLRVVKFVPEEQQAQNSRRCPSAHSLLPAFLLPSPAPWVACSVRVLRSRAGCKGPEPLPAMR